MNLAAQVWLAQERLLFDPELRARFLADRAEVLEALDIPPRARPWFLALDAQGLSLDAELRGRYLMSTLCRAYPLSSAALGAAPEGPERLSAFLASPALFGSLGERSRAYGDHLSRLLELNPMSAPPELLRLLGPVLGLERALVDNGVALREAAERGQPPGLPAAPTPQQLKRGRVCLPPYLLVAELPQPSELLRAALDGVGPEDAWHRILGRGLNLDRVITVARADEAPVTVLCRGFVAGQSADGASAGGLSPLVDVRHQRVELSGRQSALLSALQQRPALKDLPPARQTLFRRLLEARVLDLDSSAG